MTRSPLFYPMHRGDTDAGGAADLQTDIMRFMAILALCLVAIFALVQSIPLLPEPEKPPVPAQAAVTAARTQPVDQPAPTPIPQRTVEAAAEPEPEPVVLTRPARMPQPAVVQQPRPEPQPAPQPEQVTTAPADSQGFTLRFESDIALTRLVAAGQVGFYAVGAGRTWRMTVSQSRISFWDASTPNAFHEMETATVPGPVVDALARTGADTRQIDWGVTLPGKLRLQLDTLLHEHAGGALVIGADGNLRLEAS